MAHNTRHTARPVVVGRFCRSLLEGDYIRELISYKIFTSTAFSLERETFLSKLVVMRKTGQSKNEIVSPLDTLFIMDPMDCRRTLYLEMSARCSRLISSTCSRSLNFFQN